MKPTPFDPEAYGPTLAGLLATPRMPPLGPGSIDPMARDALRAFNPSRDLGRPVVDAAAAQACLAGLWLLHDGLDESHTISQDLASSEGSFWHAVMHRREPDAWNSKYWFRKVGTHPVLKRLAEDAPALGYRYTSAAEFVDFCEKVRSTGTADEELARNVQRLEWQLLFDHCYRQAVG